HLKNDEINNPSVSRLAPNAPAQFKEDGTPNHQEWLAAGVQYPFNDLLQTFTSKIYDFKGGINLSYKFFDGLTFSTSFGTGMSFANSYNKRPSEPSSVVGGTPNSPTATWGKTQNNNIIIEPQLTYNVIAGPG